ncbi:hypothetical protein BDN71DRAFT_1455245 [Pleurotus eryngii]|uniref:Uncharacterized protein n=1 Tax=Pleurotus eryngii TaxID=5323 RepID=A0A9P5ZQF5_PLEER|nr:hypothetical protein BDN71DRAFT_1455245 [Pleurotus eryngii]
MHFCWVCDLSRSSVRTDCSTSQAPTTVLCLLKSWSRGHGWQPYRIHHEGRPRHAIASSIRSEENARHTRAIHSNFLVIHAMECTPFKPALGLKDGTPWIMQRGSST